MHGTRDIHEMSKNIYKKMQIFKELRNFTQTALHSWPREVDPWSRVHIDHVYITGVVRLLILVGSFFRLV